MEQQIWSYACTYRRIRFRSKLEAMWASYLDHLEIEWTYEPGTYLCGNDLYRPDFYLPGLNCWLEVKGGHLERIEKVGRLVLESEGTAVIGFSGGRFLVVSFLDAESKEPHYAPYALIARDHATLGQMMERGCFVETDQFGKNAIFRMADVEDFGICPEEGFGVRKGRTEADGSEVLSYRWTGKTWWSNRGFDVPLRRIRRVHEA